MEIEETWRERKKTILFTDKIMLVKAKKKGKECCLDYYLFSCNNSKREKRKSIFSPSLSAFLFLSCSFSSVVGLFFLLAGKRSNNDE
jgi:hypothetical protein